MNAVQPPAKLQRLDQAMVDRGLASSRTKAAQAAARGTVEVNGEVCTKAATKVRRRDRIVVTEVDHYVSRAAHKLLGALQTWHLAPAGRALDAGASTGGFTQVLLECGVSRVYAMDVGHDQLHESIRSDDRVVVREGLNLRELTMADVDHEPVDWLVADVSFISLILLMAPLLATLAPTGHAVLMIKPQFEVGRAGLNSQGVVRDEELRTAAVARVIASAAEHGWQCVGSVSSTVLGEYGNREQFVHLRRNDAATPILRP